MPRANRSWSSAIKTSSGLGSCARTDMSWSFRSAVLTDDAGAEKLRARAESLVRAKGLLADGDVEARVAIREQQGVGRGLLLVANGERGEVAQSFRQAAHEHRQEPAEEGQYAIQVTQDPRDDERGDREDQPKRHRPAVLRLRWVDLEVDRVARLASEPGKRICDQQHVGVDVSLVAQEGGEEVVESFGRLSGDQGGDPVGERGQDGDNAPERKPDQVWDREDQPEERGQAIPLQIVGDDEPDRVADLCGRWHCLFHAAILEQNQRPSKLGGRFPRNAATPSRKSSVWVAAV